MCVLELLEEVVADGGAVVGVDEAEGVEAAALRVAGGGARLLGQVALHEGERVRLVASVHHPQRGGRRQLGPVGGARQPLEIFSECNLIVIFSLGGYFE